MTGEIKTTVDSAGIISADAAGVLSGKHVPIQTRGDETNAGCLIINADDWGRDQENTNRTLDCIRRGTVSSVSAMVFMDDSERAAAIAREREIDAGLHLNFTTPFSGAVTSDELVAHQRRISSCLLRSRFASVMFYPQLAKSFEFVAAAQFDEYSRLYGRAPVRVDGHHHMHLCANVLIGKLIPDGTIVRRNFSFQLGEKRFANRLYRAWVDRRLSRQYQLVDLFFSLEPFEPIDRVQRIFSYARRFTVEVETHPVNPKEYQFLQSGEVVREIGDLTIASRFETSSGRRSRLLEKPLTLRVTEKLSSRSTACRPTVLVGFAEAASAPEVVWSLVDAGCNVIAFARKGRRSALRHSHHVRCHDICAPESNLEACRSELRGLLLSVGSSISGLRALLPLDDKAVMLCSRVSLGQGWILAGPAGAHADLALHKSLQLQLARDAGFNVPQTMLTQTENDIRRFVALNSYPIILKSAECVPTDSMKVQTCPHWICANEGELTSALAAWKKSVPLLVQPFILGVGEGIFGFATGDGVRAWSGHRRLRMMNPQGSGSSACISQSVSEDLRQKAEDFIKRSGWRGMFMIELLRERSGKVWFVEFNGRSWGSMALSRRQGLEYPAWQVALALNPRSQAGKAALPASDIVSRNLGRELMHLLFVFRGPKSSAMTEWPSFWSSLTGIVLPHRTSTLYNWRREDWRVFAADVCYTMKNNLFKASN